MEHTGFRVMRKRCDQCLFGNNKIVGDERREEVLEEAARSGGFFQCHKATIAGIVGGCCKGFFDQSEDGIVIYVKRRNLPIQWIDLENGSV